MAPSRSQPPCWQPRHLGAPLSTCPTSHSIPNFPQVLVKPLLSHLANKCPSLHLASSPPPSGPSHDCVSSGHLQASANWPPHCHSGSWRIPESLILCLKPSVQSHWSWDKDPISCPGSMALCGLALASLAHSASHSQEPLHLCTPTTSLHSVP